MTEGTQNYKIPSEVPILHIVYVPNIFI